MPTLVRIIVVLLIGLPGFYFWLFGAFAVIVTTWLVATQSPPIPRFHFESQYLANYFALMSIGYFMFEFARILLGERPSPPARTAKAVLLNWVLQIILLASIFGAAGFFYTKSPEGLGREACGTVLGLSMVALAFCLFLKLWWTREPSM